MNAFWYPYFYYKPRSNIPKVPRADLDISTPLRGESYFLNKDFSD